MLGCGPMWPPIAGPAPVSMSQMVNTCASLDIVVSGPWLTSSGGRGNSVSSAPGALSGDQR